MTSYSLANLSASSYLCIPVVLLIDKYDSIEDSIYPFNLFNGMFLDTALVHK